MAATRIVRFVRDRPAPWVRLPPVTHGDSSRLADGGQAHLTSLILTALLLAPGLAACRPQAADEDRRHDRRSTPALIGEQFFECEDGTLLDADFLVDGLTLELAQVPDGKPIRLNAPATGLTFVGQNVNVRISTGGGIKLMRANAQPLSCIRQDPAKLGGRLRSATEKALADRPTSSRQDFE